jgi:hypothetical protein
MADRKTRIVLDDFSGGRNGVDTPLGPDFKTNQVVDAVNGDWYRTRGFRKRHGSSLVGTSGTYFVGAVAWVGRHVPGTSEADAELWGLDNDTFPHFARLDNSTTWTTPTVVDIPSFSASKFDVTCASLNGLFFIAYPFNARLHLYDAGTDTIRRTGIDPGTNAPTVANTGAGTYAAILRYYRVRFALGTGGVVRSEATPSVSFTPSGGGTHARVTQPAVPANESIITWGVEASTDNVTFYEIQAPTIAIATTTYDDGLAPAVYNSGTYPLSALTGRHSLQKAYRFIAADQNRLIGFGSYTSTDKQNRLEIGAVVGSLDKGDAERVDTTSTYYYDFDEKDSGVPTGLIGPLFGNFYPFKTRQMWELSPTGSVTDPYRRTCITKELGMVQSHAGCVGEDPEGSPCIYFMSHRGFARYGQDGLDLTVGRGIEDLILGPTSVMNMAATQVICHMVYHTDRQQVWVWWTVGAGSAPTVLGVLNVRSGGWARYTGLIADAYASVMFADSLGGTMGFALKPYSSSTDIIPKLRKCDDTAVTQDNAVSYQAYVTTRPLEPAGPGMRGATGDAIVLAPPASGVTLTATLTPDFGAGTAKTGTALLTAAGSETRVSKRLEGSAIGHAEFVSITIGDSAAANNTWSFDRITIPLGGQEPIS